MWLNHINILQKNANLQMNTSCKKKKKLDVICEIFILSSKTRTRHSQCIQIFYSEILRKVKGASNKTIFVQKENTNGWSGAMLARAKTPLMVVLHSPANLKLTLMLTGLLTLYLQG